MASGTWDPRDASPTGCSKVGLAPEPPLERSSRSGTFDFIARSSVLRSSDLHPPRHERRYSVPVSVRSLSLRERDAHPALRATFSQWEMDLPPPQSLEKIREEADTDTRLMVEIRNQDARSRVLMTKHHIDARTIEACQRGDSEAFRQVFEAYKDRVYSIALCFFDGNEA